MNELREQIANELDTFRTVANARSRGGDDPMDVAWEFVPRFMALIAEAMLSDEAVEAAELDNWEHGGYASAYEDIATAMRRSVREIIGYGLAAAGITGAGQEGGEEAD